MQSDEQQKANGLFKLGTSLYMLGSAIFGISCLVLACIALFVLL